MLLGLLLALALGHELLDLGLVVLVELDVVLAHQVVALHARRGGRLAAAVELPCQHRLADVDATVIDQVGLDDRVAVGLEDLRHGVTQQVVADVAQVQRLVRIGRRILDHDRAPGGRSLAVAGIGSDLGEALAPERAVEREVQKALDDVERRDLRNVRPHVFAYLGRGGLGRLAASSQQRKGHERVSALELPAGLLNLQLLVAERAVKRLHRTADRFRNKGFDIHVRSNKFSVQI